MSAKNAAQPLEPNVADFGNSRLKRLWFATRPAFLPASIAPVLVGTAWGYAVSGAFNALSFVLALLATCCVHAASNVINDVGDDAIGTDPANNERIFPFTGGSRFIQNGVLSQREMRSWGITLLFIALVPGAALVWLHGPMVLAFGAIGVAIGVLYSTPKVQLTAHGLGEAGVAIAFGLLPVIGAAWLQTGVIDWPALLISIPVAMWVASILLINEVPDIRADAAAGKRTLVVRFGVPATRRIYIGLQMTAIAAFVASGLLGLTPWWAALVALILIPRALSGARAICDVRDGRAQLTSAIQITLSLHTIGSLLLCAVILVGAML